MPIVVPVRLESVRRLLIEVHGGARPLTRDERVILRRWVRRMELAIELQWPVDTGTSRDGFRSIISGNDQHPVIGGYGYAFLNDVAYVQWVRRAGEKAAGLTFLWRRLIPQIVQAFNPSLLAELEPAIRATEARLAAGRRFEDIMQQTFRPPSSRPSRPSLRLRSVQET